MFWRRKTKSNKSPAANTASAAGSATEAPKTKPRRSKWRWVFWSVLIIVFLTAMARLAVVIVLPPVLSAVAGKFGLTATYDRLDLDVMDSDVGIWHFVVRSKDGGGDPIVQSNYLRCNLSTWGLLHGKLIIRRLEAEGVELLLERKADGTIPLLSQFTSTHSNSSTPAQTTMLPNSIDLTSPIRIDAFRLTNIHAHIIDAAVSPKVDARVDLNLLLTDLASPVNPTHIELNMSAAPMLDLLQVEGTGSASGKIMDANFRVQMRGLHLIPASGYLQPLGIQPVAHYISAQLTGELKTAASQSDPNGVSADLLVQKVSADADGQEVAGMDTLHCNADALNFNVAHIVTLLIDGVRLRAQRSPNGILRVAGVDLVPTPPPPAGSANPTVAAAPPTLAPQVPFAPLKWGVDQFELSNVTAAFDDQGVSPPAALGFRVAKLTATGIDSDHPQNPATLLGRFSSPGIADDIRLDGSTTPLADIKTLDLKLAVNNLRPDAIKSYLDHLGLQSDYTRGQFLATLHTTLSRAADGTLTADAKVSDVKLTDHDTLKKTDAVLLALNTIDVKQAYFDPMHDRLGVASLDISGPKFVGRKDAHGSLHLLGLHTKPPVITATPAALVSTPGAAPAGTVSTVAASPLRASITDWLNAIPKLHVGEFSWKGVNADLTDEAVTPPQKVSLTNLAVVAHELNLDFDLKDPPAATGDFALDVAAKNLADKLAITGKLQPIVGGTTLDFTVDGKGITSQRLETYFANSPIKPDLHSGSISLNGHADMQRQRDALEADLSLKNLHYADGDKELASLDEFNLVRILLQKGSLGVDEIDVVGPRLSAEREADGSLRSCGLHYVPSTQPAVTTPDKFVLSTATTAPAVVATNAVAAAPLRVGLGKLEISSASFHWLDRAKINPASNSPVEAHLLANVGLDNLSLNAGSPPATVLVTLHEDHSLNHLIVAGQVLPSLDSPMAQLTVDAAGIRGGPLAAYLPPGIAVNLQDGRFAASLDASAALAKPGGRSFQFKLSKLDYRDGADGPALCKLDEFSAVAPRIDVPGRVIALDSITALGLEAAVTKHADGSLSAMGLTLAQPPAETPATQPAAVAPVEPPAAAAPLTLVTGSTPVAAVQASDLARLAHKRFPLITLQALKLQLKKFQLTDESRPDSKPLALSNFYLWSPDPISLLGDFPGRQPPVHLQTSGSVDPLVSSVNIDIVLTPFTRPINLTVTLSVAGIHGQGVNDVLPNLADTLDGSTLTDGRFSAHFDATILRSSTDPTDMDFTRGFTAEATLKDVTFRDGEKGKVLAGVEQVLCEGIRVQPLKSTVMVREITISNPSAQIYRDNAGVHVLGLTIKLPAAAANATTAPSKTTVAKAKVPAKSFGKTPVKIAAATPPPAASAAPATPPAGEIRLERILISGLDFNFEDYTCKPPLVVPLNALDVEVRDISSLMPYEDKPLRFNALLNAGKVPLPRRTRGNAVAGALGDTFSLLAGKKAIVKSDIQMRDLFSEISASGQVSLYPALHGWVKTSVSGFDLASLEGEAKQMGISLGGGTFDTNLNLRLNPDGTMDANTRLVLTDLALSEPPNGPIVRYLHIGAPLDVVIGALQDQDGSITIPLDIPIKSGSVNGGDVAGAASLAMTRVIVAALAAAPLKAADTVAALLPLGGHKQRVPDEPINVNFAAGDTTLSLSQLIDLRPLVKRMRDDSTLVVVLRHNLGTADVARAAILANPSPEDCLNIARRLRQNKSDLLIARAAASEEAAAQLASGFGDAAAASITRLRNLDAQIAANETAMDRVYDMLRPGAQKQADRRTRGASIEIGEDRLAHVADVLKAAGIPDAADRVRAAHATFNPTDGVDNGSISILISHRK